MTEQEASTKALEILRKAYAKELTIDDGEELLLLEDYIEGNKFSDFIEAFYASAPTEVGIEFTRL